MKHKIIFAISLAGILAGAATAIFFSIKKPPLPAAFSPASNPYGSNIYAEGIVESAQSSGENINMYPEVAGTVKEILVYEGQQVKAGDLLLRLDDSVQRATAEQQGSQAEAARALLNELKAQPRKETLDVAAAQVVSAEAALVTVQDTYQKDTDAGSAEKILELIRQLELPLVLLFNHSRLMVLPQAISKGTALREALNALRLSAHNAVAIGDAENDHDLLEACEVGVAVSWGSPALQKKADDVLVGDGPHAVAGYPRAPWPWRARKLSSSISRPFRTSAAWMCFAAIRREH
jgi:multidrug efflux pump subunit AcrA (membrane-fusion protein)